MYINFWYPMIRSEDLGPGKPEKVKVLGLNFAVFRKASGEAVVLSDTCVHRGGSLAGPWELGQQPRIVKDCVVCPYHGWEFAADGSCVAIPSIGYGTKPPSRAKVDAYPTVEKYGIVFAFLGDLPESERPPIMEVEEHGTPEWRRGLRSFAEREGHRYHARHHRGARHQDWSKTFRPSFRDRVFWRVAVFANAHDCAIHEQDGVLRHEPDLRRRDR